MNLPSPKSQTSPGGGPAPGAEVAVSLDAIASLQAQLEPRARILVVEDNQFVRAGIVKLINRQSELVCCGEADSIASAPLAMAEQKPDLVLLDLRLKDGEAFELIGKLKTQCPEVPILILSQCEESLYAERALRLGARGYIMKQEAAGELLTAIRAVLQGKSYLSRAMAQRLPRELNRG